MELYGIWDWKANRWDNHAVGKPEIAIANCCKWNEQEGEGRYEVRPFGEFVAGDEEDNKLLQRMGLCRETLWNGHEKLSWPGVSIQVQSGMTAYQLHSVMGAYMQGYTEGMGQGNKEAQKKIQEALGLVIKVKEGDGVMIVAAGGSGGSGK